MKVNYLYFRTTDSRISLKPDDALFVLMAPEENPSVCSQGVQVPQGAVIWVEKDEWERMRRETKSYSPSEPCLTAYLDTGFQLVSGSELRAINVATWGSTDGENREKIIACFNQTKAELKKLAHFPGKRPLLRKALVPFDVLIRRCTGPWLNDKEEVEAELAYADHARHQESQKSEPLWQQMGYSDPQGFKNEWDG